MTMKLFGYFLTGLLLAVPVRGQDDIPLLRPEELEVVDEQADEFNAALAPVLVDAAKSTVRVWAGTRRLAYGTVVGDGSQILSKWSELARARGNLRVEADGAVPLPVKVVGVYAAEDLVLLEVVGAPLTPVKWSFEPPQLGSFLVAPQPDGRPAAFGVVSVLERNLRDTDQAFIGIIGAIGYSGPGVKVDEVSKDTGAAAAGLKKGDVILKVGDRAISGLLELKNALTGVVPGETVKLWVDAGDGGKALDVVVGNRPKLPQFSGRRLQQMERMGGAISEVRDSFTRVIQTDMRPKPNQVGGPVVDLQGRVVGITMARADRTRSFVMPAAAVVEILKQKAEDAEVAMAAPAGEPEEEVPVQADGSAPKGRMIPGGEERVLRHLSDMERLMEHLREELDGLGLGR